MTEKEYKEWLKVVEDAKNLLKTSPEEGRKPLVKAGILTKRGHFTKRYKILEQIFR